MIQIIRVSSLLLLPALVFAGTIVQTGTVNAEGTAPRVSLFQSAGQYLTAVEAELHFSYGWYLHTSVTQGTDPQPGRLLDPPARLTTSGAGRLTMHGTNTPLTAPVVSCEFVVAQEGTDILFCPAEVDFLFVGDVGAFTAPAGVDPEDALRILVMPGQTMPDVQCDPGSAGTVCRADVQFGGQLLVATYTLTYTFAEVPEPSMATLVPLTLLAIGLWLTYKRGWGGLTTAQGQTPVRRMWRR